MIPLTIHEIARVTAGEILQERDAGLLFKSVSTDSRAIKAGDLFIALRGERYDAHSFLKQAAGSGAGGLIVSSRTGLPPGIHVVMVEDTLTALHKLAAYNRECCRPFVIGVTGSTGKTTTKDMIASVVGTRFKTLKTVGNFNNEIGLPLTLLEMDSSCQAAVVEMAMRGPGEIGDLCRTARPTAAVITNIGETHLELLGTVSNIAAAKGEILEHIPAGGFALLHAESPFIQREALRCRGRVIFFGEGQASGIRVEKIRPEGGGSRFEAVQGCDRHEYFLPVPGRHNVMNALAAIGAGRELGLTHEEIARGLAAVALTGMRLEITETGGVTIINDAYNASPPSMKASLMVLKETAGERRSVAVLGGMLELGPRTTDGHREVGEVAAQLKLDCLVTVGDLASIAAEGAVSAGMLQDKVFPCPDNVTAATLLDELLQEGDVVLFKGSRGMKMEQIIQLLSTRRCQTVLAGQNID